MDYLASLDLDYLPEQQTRTSHNNTIVDTLTKNSDLRLGFNSCLCCGSTPLKVSCEKCGRVAYCSEKCRTEDANGHINASDGEPSHGHTSIICSLLRLCDADEACEESYNVEKKKCEESRDQSAHDRVRSEYESYPATLCNILIEAPCFQKILRNTSTTDVTVHIIGSSMDSELWGGLGFFQDTKPALNAYTEALSELIDRYCKRQLNIVFVGPQCPPYHTDIRQVRHLNKHNSSIDGVSHIQFSTFPYKYKPFLFEKKKTGSKANLPALSRPDICVFFNPGFTCPDYTDWNETLLCTQHYIHDKTPFLVTTNTEMEAVMDCQFLHENGYIEMLPPTLEAIVKEDVRNDSPSEDASDFFFGENPYAGSRVRQSGTMANDVFVKSRWMFGGVLTKYSRFQRKRSREPEKSPNALKNANNEKPKIRKKNSALI